MRPTIVLIHGGESTVRKIQAVMPEARVSVVFAGSGVLSSGYDELTGYAKQYPTLRQFMAAFVPDWRPGEPLVLLGYSAGGWALRYYLNDPVARDDITAAIYLDSTYGHSGSQCTSLAAKYQGTVEFGRLANAQPSKKRLVMAYSPSTPGPGICANAIQNAAGQGPGVFVRYFQTDHGSMQGVIGPKMVEEYIKPWIGGTGGFNLATLAGAALLVLGVGMTWYAISKD